MLTLVKILRHKEQILALLNSLTNQVKNERGYSGTGRLLTRVVHSIGEIYTLDEKFLNESEWDSKGR